MRVLLAVDSSPCSQAAVESVAGRTWSDDTRFLILTVVEPTLPEYASWHKGSISVLNEVQQELLDKARQLVDDRSDRLKDKFPRCSVEAKVLEGNIRDTILRTAEEWGADFIVMGSHGRTGFRKFLLGSVAEGVVSRARCSVEIVKLPAEE